jgi:hypothetical protein
LENLIFINKYVAIGKAIAISRHTIQNIPLGTALLFDPEG